MSVSFFAAKSTVDDFNLANASWAHLASLLGLDSYPGIDPCGGYLDPVDVLTRIGRVERAIAEGRGRELTTSTTVTKGRKAGRYERKSLKGGTWIDCGIDLERMQRQLRGLQAVAVEAIKAATTIKYQ